MDAEAEAAITELRGRVSKLERAQNEKLGIADMGLRRAGQDHGHREQAHVAAHASKIA